MNTIARSVFSLVSFAVLVAGVPAVARAAEPPANAPASVQWDEPKGQLTLEYNGSTILTAVVEAQGSDGKRIPGSTVKLDKADTRDDKGKVEQRLKFALAGAPKGAALVLRGTVAGSEQAFAAEDSPGEKQKAMPYVRTSVGLSRNLRNNAVYDRRWDWALVGPGDGATRIAPKSGGEKARAFDVAMKAPALELVFRPRYYQKHKALAKYEPWTYTAWKGSLTGYCTWWAYKHGFTQQTLDAMLKVFVEKHLPDFGYDYMQFDDTYQQGNGGCPENWLNWNKKFPGGWKYAIKAIRDAGMKPGVWVHRIHRPNDPHVKDIAKEHPDWFVRKADGSLVSNRGFHMLDTTNKEAVENMIRKLYRGLKEQGWDYVKIDGTGDLYRAYQNKECEDFFKSHPTTSPEKSLREWDIVAREELGRNVYVLACHTVANAQHVIGLADGGRLSNDGFQPDTLAQYNYMEGVVWRNDPDHCDVLGGWLMDSDANMTVFGCKQPVPARSILRPAICAMAGAVLMVSDKLEVYQDDRNIEGMKRSSPVLFTVPGQLYSTGRRPPTWWLQEIDRPFDHWNVLARFQWGKRGEGKNADWPLTGAPAEKVAFADLGLDGGREYLVFEFWSQEFLGKFTGSFTAPAMDENTSMHAYVIREVRDHPWVLSTSRHISQGGVSLLDEKWDAAAKTLSGKSAVVVGDPYVLTIHVPAGYRLTGAEVAGEKAEVTNEKEAATVRVVPAASRSVEWKMSFAQ